MKQPVAFVTRDAQKVRRLWYSETVKNVTVSLKDDVYRRARMTAAARDTSVSALVREFLETLTDQSDFERRVQLERKVLASVKRFRASDRLGRDAVHERRPVR